jgi:hypothetical protein
MKPGVAVPIRRHVARTVREFPIVTSPRPNRDIDDVVVVHDGVIGPEPSLDFAPREDLPLPFDEHRQNLEGLLPEHSLIRSAVRRK